MKTRLLLLILSYIAFHKISIAQTSGGPDAYGYRWINSLDTSNIAPAYTWKDIKDTTNLVHGLGDDNAAGAFKLGFNFDYYGKWSDSIWIGSNGWISFLPIGNIAAPFPGIPNKDAPNDFMAGMLADLTMTDAQGTDIPGAAVYFRNNHTDTAIIQYDSVPFWDSSAVGYSGRNTFQIMLVGGTEYSITFQYKTLINSIPPYNLSTNGLRIGIEDSTGNVGLQVTDTLPADSSAIKFYYPLPFSTNDIVNTTLSLSQNYPNPCKSSTAIRYTIRKNENLSISIQNIIGDKIASIPLGHKSPGSHTFNLNTSNFSPGIYFYSLTIPGKTVTRKMIVVK